MSGKMAVAAASAYESIRGNVWLENSSIAGGRAIYGLTLGRHPAPTRAPSRGCGSAPAASTPPGCRNARVGRMPMIAVKQSRDGDGTSKGVSSHCANMAIAACCARDQANFAAVAIDDDREDADLQVESTFLVAGSIL